MVKRRGDTRQDQDLESLFKPRGIAIIGASTHPEKIGYKVVDNLLKSGFKGGIYPINPHAEEILGLKCYKSVKDVLGEVDVAVIAVPAKLVKQVTAECGEKGVKFLVIITSGFSEIGNIKEEKELVEIAHKYNMRILGPNIFGIYYAPMKMNATFGPPNVLPGNIALITQSGALGIALIGKTIAEEIGLSSIVSVGNKADIDDVDLLQFFAEDDYTKVIVIYMEGTKNGRQLLQIAEKVSKDKPLIAIKAGRSEKGARAAASHTGSLAGSDKIFEAAFKQGGILRARSADEAFNWARLLASYSKSPPPGKNTVIITNGGGAGVLATDAAEEQGLHLWDDLDLMSEIFKDALPPYGSTKNPIDLTGIADTESYEVALAAALAEDKINSIILLYCLGAGVDPTKLAEAIIAQVRKGQDNKPIVVSMVGGEETEEAIKALNRSGIPAYEDPEEAVASLAALYKWRNYAKSAKRYKDKEEPLAVNWAEIQEIIDYARMEGRLQLLENEAKEILEILGLSVPRFKVVTSIRDCVKAAEEFGYPLVLKIVSEDIIHKTEAGGIKLNLQSKEEVESAYKSIMASTAKRYPRARIRGMLVTEMIQGGIEVIVGSSNDPSFGPTIMFGLGGIYVEVLKDVVFKVAPISKSEAKKMIGEIRSSTLLHGVRGEEKKDIDALAEAIYRISRLVDKIRDIVELDINPMRVLKEGQGCKVLDARITISRNEVER